MIRFMSGLLVGVAAVVFVVLVKASPFFETSPRASLCVTIALLSGAAFCCLVYEADRFSKSSISECITAKPSLRWLGLGLALGLLNAGIVYGIVRLSLVAAEHIPALTGKTGLVSLGVAMVSLVLTPATTVVGLRCLLLGRP